jgi:5-methylthioadenosine/S-adenosylhomocysteine deaminase
MTRVLIQGGCVLSLHPRTGNHHQADVLVEDDKIAEIGPELRARDAEVIDASNAIVMPGFVDTHRHAWQSLHRGLGDADGAPGLATQHGAHYSPDDVYAATLVGLLGAAEAGITSMVHWFELGADDRLVAAALEAHADAGLRTVLVLADSQGGDASGAWAAGLRRRAADAAHPLVTLGAGTRDLNSGDLDRVSRDWALARDLGLRIHAHAGRNASDRGVVADLATRGVLGTDVTLVHCSHLGDAELDAIAASGVAVSLTPASDMAAGLPPLPVQKLIDRGIRPGLGVDVDRFGPGDMFAQIRSVISLQHATHFELKLAGKAGLPRLLTTREVIRYGTTDGARAVGLGEVTGSLAPGMQADIIVLRTDRPNIFPINDPIGAVVWGMDTSNLDWVLVAGRLIMRDGVLQADLGRARELATAARQRLSAAIGLPTAAALPAGGPAATTSGEPR